MKSTYTPHEAILDFLAASGAQYHSSLVHEVIAQCPEIKTLSEARAAVLQAVFALDSAGLIESDGEAPASFDLTEFGWEKMMQGGQWVIQWAYAQEEESSVYTYQFNHLIDAQIDYDSRKALPEHFHVFGPRPR